MTARPIALIGPGVFARINTAEENPTTHQFPIHWDRPTPGPDETFTLTEVGPEVFTIQHQNTKRYLGADATEFNPNGNIYDQYTTHATAPGPYETWTVKRVRPGDTIVAFVEFDRDGHRYTSQSLTVVEL